MTRERIAAPDDKETWREFVIRISRTHSFKANATVPIVRGEYMTLEHAVAMASDAVHLAIAEKPVQVPIDNADRISNVITLLTAFLVHDHVGAPTLANGELLGELVRVSLHLTTLCEDVVNNRVAPDGTDSPNDAPVKGEG